MKMSRFNVTHGDDAMTLIMNARGGGILYLNREYTEKFTGFKVPGKHGAVYLDANKPGSLVRG